jgi:2-polyprenyl-6-methoxyphenol hydroxylase-like FAD-dependent oxidoreductase
MESTVQEITIIGAGIAGLTTAIVLKQIGKSFIVFESTAEIKAVGAGLGMGANAIKAFDKLGIKQEVIQRGRFLESFTIYDRKGKKITRTDNAALSEKYGVDNFTIHRAELHKLLLSKLDNQNIQVNKKALDFEQKQDSLIIKFADGSSHETRFLICAEGIHSHFRRKLKPQSLPRYAGYSCWRSVIENSSLNISETSETWGNGRRFGIVPLADNKIYWFACINGPENDSRFRNFKISDLQKYFIDFHDPIPAILEQTKDEDLLWNDIIDIEPISQYAYKNILLIGDAAHATTPNLGQGACQAIEDAVILANEIQKKADISNAFEQFEKRRLKRTHFVTNTSWRIGKIAQIQNPFIAALRNFVFRLIPASVNEKQLEKLYNVDF